MKNKVLLVEDEADLTLIVSDTLHEQGYEVLTANDGVEGLEKFKSQRADIVVADVMMPKKDGFAMAKEIKKLSPDVPLLFLTAKNTIDDVEEGFEIGANDYLKKPFELRELIVRIKALLKRYHKESKDETGFKIGEYVFNMTSQTLEIEGKETVLSYFEARYFIVLQRISARRLTPPN